MEKSPESSPEFEFWMVSNPPSFPQPQELLTPDELFADGVILPLIHPNPNPNPSPDPSSPPDQDSSLPPPPPTKKWKHIIFRPRERREKSKAAAASAAPSSAMSSAAAELNINIWPFSRSRSAGNAGPAARGRASASGRRSCSAPCSRSNSRGEGPAAAGGGRRWGQLGGGIHVGRSGPVWQLKRGGNGNGSGNVNGKKSGGGMHVLNLKNVNTCIGYGSQVRDCRGEDKEEVTGGDRTADGGGKGTLFSIRAMFSKKVH